MSTTTARLGLSRPQRGDRDWDDDIQGWLDRLETYGAFGDKTLTWSALQTNFGCTALGIGTTTPDGPIDCSPPAAATTVDTGDDGGNVTLQAQPGQSTSGTTGQTAGTGGHAYLRGGTGGDAPAGSVNGAGGNVSLIAGVAGAGLGTASTPGLILLEGMATLTPQSVSLTADDQEVTVATSSLLVFTSDNATATNRTFTLTAPLYSQTGQLLLLIWNDTDAGELLDTGTVKLTATWPPATPQYATLLLVSLGSVWCEIARADNT